MTWQQEQNKPVVAQKKPRFSNVISPTAVKQLKQIPENDYCADCEDHSKALGSTKRAARG